MYRFPFHVAASAMLSATLLSCASAYASGIEFNGPTTFAGVADPVYSVQVNAADGGYDAIYFSKKDTIWPFPGDASYKTSQLTYATSTLAAYIDLYAVNAGETFAESSLAGVAIGTPSLLNGPLSERLSASPTTPTYFYLGVRTFGSPPNAGSTPWTPWRASLGWVLLENTQANGLRMVDSYVAYNAGSIVVGQVPEASVLTLTSVGLFALWGAARQRRRSTQTTDAPQGHITQKP